MPPPSPTYTLPRKDLISTTAYQCCERMVQRLRLSVPSCGQLDAGAIKRVVEKDTIGGGKSTKVHEATHENRKVALKSYCSYTSSDNDVRAAEFCNEIEAYSLLFRGGVGVVPLLGVCLDQNGAYPFRLIYEWMEGLDLRKYLKSESGKLSVETRVKLIIGIARCLTGMHHLGIVHENLRMPNILVNKDGTPYIAGLRNALILSPPQTAEDRMVTVQSCHGRAPELVDATEHTHTTKASNMYDFGLIAFEVLTGQPPFDKKGPNSAMCAMMNGDRPPKDKYPGIPDSLWDIIILFLRKKPSERVSAKEALKLLEGVSRQ